MMGLEAELKAMFAPEHWIVVEILLQLLAAYVGTVAFSILFSVPKKYHFDCGATGAIGWGVYLVISRTCDTPVIATFFSSMVLTMLARYQAVKCKAPTTVFLLSGIFTLVPGAGIYYTAANFFTGDGPAAIGSGIDTIKLAVAIGLGIGEAYSFPARMFGWKKKAEVWQEKN